MSSAILTIIGLYNYDHTLFDNMIMPEGIDRDLVIDAIIMRGGEYEVLYSDLNLLKSLIGSWSKQWYNVFSNWLRANNEIDTVNPLYNYDRLEDWTDSSANHSTSNDSMTGQGTTSGQDSSTGNTSVEDTHKISADDVNDFVNKTQDLQTSSSSVSANTSTSSTTNTQNSATTDGTVNSSHTGHLRGNIGVTTSAQMFAEWVQVLRDNGNIYDSIAYVFCTNFVIPIL